ncbi:MAG TPA: GTP 3',8-cyclase MoaA [Gemmatimonadales bacterium]|nr:GTP 3',8-cyclase MoaA [Gemmatimonadales bacterium]
MGGPDARGRMVGPPGGSRGATAGAGRRGVGGLMLSAPNRGSIGPSDRFNRPLRSLRISVTDRCNMRCGYCMPEAEYTWLPRASILTFEEINRLVGIFGTLGVSKVRLTGGEPLLRHGLPGLVSLLSRNQHLRDLALTTNGTLLSRDAAALRAAGLGRLTMSLDTLRADRMAAFARSDRHDDIIQGIHAAQRAGFSRIKVNTVVIRGFNDDELLDMLEFGKARGLEIRFIEYMDVGGATHWSVDQVVSRDEMLERIGRRYGRVVPEHRPDPAAPAERFRLPDGTRFGVIASTTAPFCGHCDRSRLTADGTWLLCLYAADGVDLRAPMRDGASDEEIAALIWERWADRADRGAEGRAAAADRGPLYQLDGLRADPHREMHTRGG